MPVTVFLFLNIDLESDHLKMSSRWRRDGKRVHLLGSLGGVCASQSIPMSVWDRSHMFHLTVVQTEALWFDVNLPLCDCAGASTRICRQDPSLVHYSIHSLASSLKMEHLGYRLSHVWKGNKKPALPISQGDLRGQCYVKTPLWKLCGALQELTE